MEIQIKDTQVRMRSRKADPDFEEQIRSYQEQHTRQKK